jgi:MoxR-like ATPase
MADFQQSIDTFQANCNAIKREIAGVIVGQDAVVDGVLTCMLAGGHALLEGVPGLGKTLLVRTLARAAGLSFGRIQFTPDLMPGDITGTTILQPNASGDREFGFAPGPVFANLVLADEINRATPKTQSALLEAMAESTVTVGDTSHALPAPFCVLATQNPIELEGTYPLPEAQRDRFMLKLLLEMPNPDDFAAILDRTTGTEGATVSAALSAEQLLAMRQTVREVALSQAVRDAIVQIVWATHPDCETAPELARRAVRYGASPRAGQAMVLAGKVRALLDGRANVAFEDIRAVAPAALRHRLVLSFQGQADGITPDDVITAVLDQTTS